MRRRAFIGLIGAAALGFPRPGYAQTKTDLPLVGVLYPGTPDVLKVRIAALRSGLQEAGFIEGKNYSLAIRFANGDFGRLPSLVKEVGDLKPKVIVVAGGLPSLTHKLFPNIPIVFTAVAADPIAAGLAPSLPGKQSHSPTNVVPRTISPATKLYTGSASHRLTRLDSRDIFVKFFSSEVRS
jgi:putative tryptophan/tyrosine transport system substrate-binding protein